MRLDIRHPFKFQGRISASKSMLNRALILKSWKNDLVIEGDSLCEDVLYLRRALNASEGLASGRYECGHGGTTLRFLSFRLSRKVGHFFLGGQSRLLQRPQQDLVDILSSLGVVVSGSKEGLSIDSQGWQDPRGTLSVSTQLSSQFLSGLLLSSWELPFALRLKVSEERVSQGYLNMTLEMLSEAGMHWHWEEDLLLVPQGQSIKAQKMTVEPDMSSAFVVAALATIGGQAVLLNMPRYSLQPDFEFVKILREMGVGVEWCASGIKISSPLSGGSTALRPVEVNLKSCPDLFPVLAVLCSLAEGVSRLFGAPQLIHKESSRIDKTAELLQLMGVSFLVRGDGMDIHGRGRLPLRNDAFLFDPAEDHRMAMAAAVASQAGYVVDLSHPQVVKKSFPDFWQILGGSK
jgi:3-phosphoshikimate 1-carboxyvinyltransferase